MSILTQPKVDDDREAFAPYNFIPLPEMVLTVDVKDLPDQGIFDANLHTGYLDCELTTASPMFIRAGLTPDQVKEKKESKDLPVFFYLNSENQPVIPGSSLRGMLRTLVEIVTFSKIGAVSKTPLVYRSVGGKTNHDESYRLQMLQSDNKVYKAGETKLYTPLIKGGYMVQLGARDWAIRPAKMIGGTTYAHIGRTNLGLSKLTKIKNCKNAYEIFIKTGTYQYQDVKEGFLKVKFAKVIESDASLRPGLRPATLAISGDMYSKKSEAVIYEPDSAAPLFHLSDEQIDNYVLQKSKEQEDLLGKEGALNHGQPVFYLLDDKTNQVIFFGHARMFRVPYRHSPLDYVPEYAKPAEEPSNLDIVDFAEAIFGYTRNITKAEGDKIPQKFHAYAGRVSCTDGILETGQTDIWLSEDPITPKVLASPKPTTFQHYLVQPEPNYYPSGKSKPDTKLLDYDSNPNQGAVIRGHKFYWHKGAVQAKDIVLQGKSKDTVLTKIHPLKAGVTFKFQVRFENLTDMELGALIWIFNIAADENMRLKLGMGKPLGLGAAQVCARLFISRTAERYTNLLDEQNWSGLPKENL
ncbi:MAG: TIGR03986 family CRISPR-associated RAMP protein [Anaerolineales bacterium]|jgi:CRISPR-associated protein (TIGR03986 family)|nr:TIGR03986 family CRISPR-associated RAMP protein [Anaerolineales bacterium]